MRYAARARRSEWYDALRLKFSEDWFGKEYYMRISAARDLEDCTSSQLRIIIGNSE